MIRILKLQEFKIEKDVEFSWNLWVNFESNLKVFLTIYFVFEIKIEAYSVISLYISLLITSREIINYLLISYILLNILYRIIKCYKNDD